MLNCANCVGERKKACGEALDFIAGVGVGISEVAEEQLFDNTREVSDVLRGLDTASRLREERLFRQLSAIGCNLTQEEVINKLTITMAAFQAERIKE